jgi:cell division initiation protein
MTLTPVEIRHIKLRHGLLGYRRTAVDQVLDEIVTSFEDVWRDRADLADRVEQLEADLVRYRELETLLRTTLVSAERASQDLREQAKRESEVIITEAHAEARSIVRVAAAERERLTAEARRAAALLRAALDSIEDAAGENEPREAEAA